MKADNLIELVADGGMASVKAAARIREIEEEKRKVEVELANVTDDLTEGATYIRGWVELLANPYELY